MSRRYIARRLAQLVLVLLVVSFFSFSLLKLLPGDEVSVGCTFCAEAEQERFIEENALDDPFVVQYVKWLGRLATGDLGRYYDNDQAVTDVLSRALPVTLQLMAYATLVALAVAIPLGVATAYKAGSVFDRISSAAAFGMLAVPNFVLAIYLSYLLSVKWSVFPFSGYESFGTDPVRHFQLMVLPTLSLAVGQIAVYMRLLRSDMIQTLQEDYITMAKAKGLPPRRILLGHAMRPSSLTLLTVAGINIGTLISGSIVIEQIFSLPGVGSQLVFAILNGELIAAQAYIALIGITYVLLNFVIDLLYGVVDPRIRYG